MTMPGETGQAGFPRGELARTLPFVYARRFLQRRR